MRRTLIAFLLLFALYLPPAAALETARQLAQGGAPRLALNRVEQLQPRDARDPGWAEWEALRFGLLGTLGRHQDALARAAALPREMPERELRVVLLAAARAGAAAGQGGAARTYAAHLLWRLGASPDEARALRLLVIESYLAEKNGEEAFRAMLRYTQDYQPVERPVAGRFVEALLDLGMEREAANWLARLEDTSAAKLLLRLKANLLSPEAAAAQARAQLAKVSVTGGGAPGFWQVIAEVAARQGNRTLRLEALERQLAAAKDGAAQARSLWREYSAGAQDLANQNQLLTGDDNAWSDFAARRVSAEPFLSRAFYAYLAQRGRTPAARQNAQLQLAHSLQQAGLERAALRLFEHAPFTAAALDLQARYLLGAMAETHNEPALAARFWDGLAAPPGEALETWQARLALAYWGAGNADATLAALKRATAGGRAFPSEAMQRGLLLAREMLAAGRLELADQALAALLPLAVPVQRRDILFSLGRIAEATAQFAPAADYYLRAALLAGSRAPDALALQARLAAALNLVRAGYREDARAQFEWLLRNSRDAAQLEIVRRELAKL
ncbi:MAG: hypothetical protein HYS46_01215 [Betaproteobacteria bacterium]|nr:hypothetical protein [Betaproteobacteria bacterium]